MRKINLKSAAWKEDKYYISQCLDVDISSFGKTKKEAMAGLTRFTKIVRNQRLSA